jgi:glycerophosphoryl diester phosphodiesterase
MTEQTPEDSDEGWPRRFDVELFIVHPTLDTAEITAELGLKPQNSHRVGDRRQAPNGVLLSGVYRDTRWRHSIEIELKDQWFSEQVTKLVDQLIPHRQFLKNLRATGGKAQIIVQFFDAYYGDEIDRETLRKLIDLELDLGIECFSEPQS